MKKTGESTTATSLRKPLRDVSNNNHNRIGRYSKRETTHNPIAFKRGGDGGVSAPAAGGGGGGDEECLLLDQLSLIRSHLSSLTRQMLPDNGQIDELVAQAIESKGASEEGREQVESFARFLSEMLSSLKPWVPRFQELVSCSSSETMNKLEQCFADQSGSFPSEDSHVEVENGSPQRQDPMMDSLVSPSPLVSWRENGRVERGRQLFLLTPLPLSKTVRLKHQDLSQSAFERFTLNPAVEVPSLLPISADANDELLEGTTISQTPIKSLDFVTTEAKNQFKCGLASNPMLPEGDCSVVVMTPCLKMPPPKSSVLLEPISMSSHKANYKFRKSTPFPVGISSNISDSSSDGSSEDLGLKYPELLGIRQAYLPATGKEKIEESPDWPFSPLKTCFLPDTNDVSADVTIDHPLRNCAAVINEQLVRTGKHVQGAFERISSANKERSFTIVESTPMWTEHESIVRRGKHPGESTLKKELWTKFEAASTYGLPLNASSFRGTAQKGFLDMLDEVSCDGESPVGDG